MNLPRFLFLIPQPGRYAGTTGTLSQTGWSLSPSQCGFGASAGDAASSPDNTVGITREQGLRPRPSRDSLLLGRRANTIEDPNHKWVINLSSKPLTQAWRSLLAKGPNYAIAPRHPPNLEYITAIESMCTKLSQQDVEQLRANINRVLRGSHPQV